MGAASRADGLIPPLSTLGTFNIVIFSFFFNDPFNPAISFQKMKPL